MRSSSRTASGRLAAAAFAALLLAGLARAYPEGAPWGAANPDAEESCFSCHYDYDAVRDSEALRLDGLPGTATPGSSYPLRVTLTVPEAKSSGFQLLLAAGDDPAGRLLADDPEIETIGAAARTTKARAATGTVSWQLSWLAPPAPGARVTFHLAASAANDDQSPFGDRIHYRAFRVSLEED